MFETEEFRKQIQEAFITEAANNKTDRYEPEIIEYLQRLASENERLLMEREVRKTAAQRRGIRDALRSVEELTREASRYAAADKRTTVQLADMQKAYVAKLCQVWPFCRS